MTAQLSLFQQGQDLPLFSKRDDSDSPALERLIALAGGTDAADEGSQGPEGMIYRENWPACATLYAGQHGPLPRKGQSVMLTNAWNGEQRPATVTEINTSTREYTVTLTLL